MKILALECATETCSVALWLDDRLLERASLARGPAHGEALLPMVAELLAEAQVTLASLDLIAVGRGPGAFTGVRLAISVAQGLAYASGLRVLGISTLAGVAQQALQRAPGAESVLVCQDARMGELYTARFRVDQGRLLSAGSERLCRPELLGDLPDPALSGWLGAGTGFAAFPQLATALPGSGGRIVSDTLPMARAIAELAARSEPSQWLRADELQPVYLRDSVAKPAAVNKP